MANKVTGVAATFVYNGVSVYITKASPKFTREMADSTDSGNYDATSQMIHKEQLPVSLQTELSVEGMYRTGGTGPTTSTLLAQLYSGNAAVTGTVKIDGSNQLITGKWDITDFEADVPIDNAVTFKATLKSNGTMTIG